MPFDTQQTQNSSGHTHCKDKKKIPLQFVQTVPFNIEQTQNPSSHTHCKQNTHSQFTQCLSTQSKHTTHTVTHTANKIPLQSVHTMPFIVSLQALQTQYLYSQFTHFASTIPLQSVYSFCKYNTFTVSSHALRTHYPDSHIFLNISSHTLRTQQSNRQCRRITNTTTIPSVSYHDTTINNKNSEWFYTNVSNDYGIGVVTYQKLHETIHLDTSNVSLGRAGGPKCQLYSFNGGCLSIYH